MLVPCTFFLIFAQIFHFFLIFSINRTFFSFTLIPLPSPKCSFSFPSITLKAPFFPSLPSLFIVCKAGSA